jgi:hypothetical protein
MSQANNGLVSGAAPACGMVCVYLGLALPIRARRQSLSYLMLLTFGVISQPCQHRRPTATSLKTGYGHLAGTQICVV